jgi:hypothetical protein
MDDDGNDQTPISNEELGEIFATIEAEEEKYAKLRFLTTAQMPCMECGGQGSVPGGILGEFCPSCGGSRFVEQPGEEPRFQMPDFDGMRLRLQAYARALDDHLLPAGHPAKQQLALPARSTLPTREEMTALGRRFKELKASLKEKPLPQLPAARQRREDGVLGPDEDDAADLSDDELDDMEGA